MCASECGSDVGPRVTTAAAAGPRAPTTRKERPPAACGPRPAAETAEGRAEGARRGAWSLQRPHGRRRGVARALRPPPPTVRRSPPLSAPPSQGLPHSGDDGRGAPPRGLYLGSGPARRPEGAARRAISPVVLCPTRRPRLGGPLGPVPSRPAGGRMGRGWGLETRSSPPRWRRLGARGPRVRAPVVLSRLNHEEDALGYPVHGEEHGGRGREDGGVGPFTRAGVDRGRLGGGGGGRVCEGRASEDP